MVDLVEVFCLGSLLSVQNNNRIYGNKAVSADYIYCVVNLFNTVLRLMNI